MTPRAALDFIRRHGVVLEAARGLEPSLAQQIAGAPISGGWWGHPKGHEIYALIERMRDSRAVLVCTLARGRITYIHRRLWPAFIRHAASFAPGSLNQVREVHTASGRHVRADVEFPDWVSPSMRAAARALSARDARLQIEPWLQRYAA